MRIYTFDAHGTIIPYTLKDIQAALLELGHDVYVGSPAPTRIAAIDGIISTAPDMVITVDRVGLFPAYLAVMAKPTTVISWFFDDPVAFLRASEDNFLWLNDKYRLFSWDRSYLPELHHHGFGHCYYLPFASNPNVYTPSDDKQFKYDVSFVATYNEFRATLVQRIAESGICVDVFGDAKWQQATHPNIHYHGPADNRTECSEIYRTSKINLNITNAQLKTALPVRIFDVMASGGFMLTDLRDDAITLFKPDRDLKIYTDTDDLIKQINYYLNHVDERESIATTGCEAVRQNFTFRKQLDKMLQLIETNAVTGSDNTPQGMPQEKMHDALKLTGFSYLKFGFLQEAHERLMTAIDMKADSSLLLALAMLAAKTGQKDAVSNCIEILKPDITLKDHLIDCARNRTMPSCWHLVYRGMYNGKINEDGTLPGWQPKQLPSIF